MQGAPTPSWWRRRADAADNATRATSSRTRASRHGCARREPATRPRSHRAPAPSHTRPLPRAFKMGGADPSGGGGDHSGGIHMTDSGRTGAYGVLMAVVVWMGGAGRTSGGARARTAR